MACHRKRSRVRCRRVCYFQYYPPSSGKCQIEGCGESSRGANGYLFDIANEARHTVTRRWQAVTRRWHLILGVHRPCRVTILSAFSRAAQSSERSAGSMYRIPTRFPQGLTPRALLRKACAARLNVDFLAARRNVDSRLVPNIMARTHRFACALGKRSCPCRSNRRVVSMSGGGLSRR